MKATPTRWSNAERTNLAKLGNTLSVYIARQTASSSGFISPSRIICPDSGATSIMGPHSNMLSKYVDLRGKGLVVQLGDKDKTVPIAGRGTLSINMLDHKIAYTGAVHVPDLSFTLLSSRVHRRITPGCSFVADHSGRFLTYLDVAIEVDDCEDCTIPCSTVQPSTSYDFDSQLYLLSHSSKSDVRRCLDLQLEHTHQARLVALRKSRAHLIASPEIHTGSLPMPDKEVASSPTRPVYLVPDSGTKSTEHISSYDLKRMFRCRTLQDWRMLERTGTGLHVFHEGEPPLSIGYMATINRNRHGKLLSQPRHALHTVGMDTGYGKGTIPGGHKYALTLVNLATRHTWVYGLRTKGADSIIDTLCSLFIDAEGIPKCIRCNFDSSFVKRQVYAFLCRKGI
jgi:hypothetical protein